jgi:hypothetical protein
VKKYIGIWVICVVAVADFCLPRFNFTGFEFLSLDAIQAAILLAGLGLAIWVDKLVNPELKYANELEGRSMCWWENNNLIGACAKKDYDLWIELIARANLSNPQCLPSIFHAPFNIAYFSGNPRVRPKMGCFLTGGHDDFALLKERYPARKAEFFLRHSETELVTARMTPVDLESFRRLLDGK